MVGDVALDFDQNVAAQLPYLLKTQLFLAKYLGCMRVILARVFFDAFESTHQVVEELVLRDFCQILTVYG